MFCLGFKKSTDFKYPAPIKLEYKMYDFLEDYIDTKYFLKEKVLSLLPVIRTERRVILR